MHRPGDIIRRFAQRWDWRLGKSNVIVEGDTDVRYLQHASKVHFDRTGKHLLDERFSVVSAGTGNDGGVFGLHEKFIAVRQLADELDLYPEGGRVFHFIALFDGDAPGWRAADGLLNAVPRFEHWKDVFNLHHIMPPASGTAEGVWAAIDKANGYGRSVMCEIEDYVDDTLFALFCEEAKVEPNLSKSEAGLIHRKLSKADKPKLCRFVERMGDFETMARFIELVQALRVYARCPVVP